MTASRYHSLSSLNPSSPSLDHPPDKADPPGGIEAHRLPRTTPPSLFSGEEILDLERRVLRRHTETIERNAQLGFDRLDGFVVTAQTRSRRQAALR